MMYSAVRLREREQDREEGHASPTSFFGTKASALNFHRLAAEGTSKASATETLRPPAQMAYLCRYGNQVSEHC